MTDEQIAGEYRAGVTQIDQWHYLTEDNGWVLKNIIASIRYVLPKLEGIGDHYATNFNNRITLLYNTQKARKVKPTSKQEIENGFKYLHSNVRVSLKTYFA